MNGTSRWPASWRPPPTPTSATTPSSASCWPWRRWTRPGGTTSRCCPRHWRRCTAGSPPARILRSFPGVGGAMDWSAGRQALRHRGHRGDRHPRHPRRGDGPRRCRSSAADEIDLNDVVFSPDSRRVVTASDEGAIRVWDIATARKVGDVTVSVRGRSLGAVRQPRRPPGGGVLARGRQGAGVPRHRGQAVGVPRGPVHGHGVQPRRATPRGDLGRLGRAGLRRRHPPRGALRSPRDGTRDLAWSPDGRWIAASGYPGAHVYDARTGRLQFVTTGDTGDVNTVDWSPDSSLLATGSTTAPRGSSPSRPGRGAGSRPARRPGLAQRRALGRLLARRRAS